MLITYRRRNPVCATKGNLFGPVCLLSLCVDSKAIQVLQTSAHATACFRQSQVGLRPNVPQHCVCCVTYVLSKLQAHSRRSVAKNNMDDDYLAASSPEFRDLVDALLVVENNRLPVHKAILAAKSPIFAKLFASCSATGPDAKMEVPLDDSLLTVCTALKHVYDGCTTLNTSKLKSVEDAYHVTSFAHKYDLKQLLEECEAYLVEQVATPSNLFVQPGDAVKWTLLAERCSLSHFLAHCELFMAGVSDGAFWSNPAEQTTQLSGDSMRRMLRVGAWHRRNGEAPPAVKHLVKWQHGAVGFKRKAEEDLQGADSCTVSLQSGLGVVRVALRSSTRMSMVFSAYKRQAVSIGRLSQQRVSSLQFAFDGDRLSGNETAGELGLVAGDIMKVT